MSKEPANMNRREFLKRLGLVSLDLSVAGATIYSAGFSAIGTLLSGDNGETVEQEEKIPDYNTKALIIDRTLDGIPLKMHGVEHSANFAKSNYKSMEELIANASVVVSELDIEGAHKNSYFGTMSELCKKHGKPMIYLDSQDSSPMGVELGLGIVGFGLVNSNSSKFFKNDRTRREIINHVAKRTGGLYLFMSSFFTSLLAKVKINKDINTMFENEKYYLSHITDQRNVQITKRLKKLPSLLSDEDLSRGDYILMDYGRAHVLGVDDYLKHPALCDFKNGIYSVSYNLIDQNQIKRFEFENDKWQKTILA